MAASEEGYRELRVMVAPSLADEVTAALFGAGATGIEERGEHLAPPPGADPVEVPPGMTCLRAYFASQSDAVGAAAVVRGFDASAAIVEVPERDWNEAWRAHHKPIHVHERLWVVPTWNCDGVPEDALRVRIEPGPAFGTGAHETTQLALRRIAERVPERRVQSLFDVGCGSGILAIGAALLGVPTVVAVDIDEEAVRNTRENLVVNETPRVDVRLGDASVVCEQFDMVVANILLGPLVAEAAAIARTVKPGGVLCLTGLLFHQDLDVVPAYEKLGLRHVSTTQDGIWILVEMAS